MDIEELSSLLNKRKILSLLLEHSQGVVKKSSSLCPLLFTTHYPHSEVAEVLRAHADSNEYDEALHEEL